MKISRQELLNIRERNDKVYILADEDLHKILGPLKKDIQYLLNVIDELTFEEDYA